MTHFLIGAHIYPNASSDEHPGCESSSGQGMEEARNDSRCAVEQRKKNRKEVILEAQKGKKKVHFGTLMDSLSSQTCGVRTKILEV